MRNKIITILGVFTAFVLLTTAFSVGIVVGNVYLPPGNVPFISQNRSPLDTNTLPADHPPVKTDQVEKLPREELFAPFWEAWDIVHEQYIDQPVNEEVMMRGAISGMMEALGDPHSSYMNPDQYRQANIPMEGNYEGIGAWVDPTGEYLEIISPMPGSPAEEAGLKPGDVVLAIDGEDMTGIDGNLVIQQVMGPAGSEVTLTIQREGRSEPFNVTLIRQEITVPSVDYRMIERENLGYLQIITFGGETRRELKNALKDLLKQDPDGLIIDLRNNGGGYLQTSIQVASQFIGEGVILYEDYGYDQGMQTYEANRGGLATDIPLVVLVNQGSASASEIVAGAIQDHERGPLVGMTTFGKGSVQNWIELSNQQGAVRVTIARWLTPDKRQIHQQGLTPDYEVELTEEDFENELDPQLDKAIQVLRDLVENQGG
ncbi:MAG: S41 family peptidase [Anaerolineales bacterium]|nr:S41 family peptidase [Anaerolineales bacterium]